MKNRRFWCIIGAFIALSLVISSYSKAQTCRWIRIQSEGFILDSLTILPESIRVQNDSTVRISYDLNTGKAHFAGKYELDSVLICYQTLPLNLTKADFKRNPASYDSTDHYTENYLNNLNQQSETPREELFSLKGFNKGGNLTRGVSLGNNQNVFVNSALNLQLDGKLTEDLDLQAVISDQQVPYQPEGNTLQLQEFDRVFIRLKNKTGSLTAGDVVLQQKEGYFLKYYKNVQGALIDAQYKIGKTEANTAAGVAVAKGKFASIQVSPIEGVQGPYRLRGPNGEQFIIVLANSEKVFIDGKLLTRGFNYEYVIDYNLGEVTFNANIILTRFTRIRIDFEYAERNYARTIFSASHYQTSKKWDFFGNFYRESDNPRTPLIDLTDAQKAELSRQGTGIGLVSGTDSVGFQVGEVLYKQVDSTTVNANYRSVFVYSTAPDSAYFRVIFSEVGQGNGDYVRVNTTINGQIYQWKEPVNGIKQGNYAPFRTVPLPTQRQLFTLGTAYKLNEKERFFGEVAFSNQDLNAYSTLDQQQNKGTALKIGWQNQGKRINTWKGYEWLGGIDYEWNSADFSPIDRFRSIEFDRDWSKNIDTSRIDDHIFNVNLGIRKDIQHQILYRFSARNRGKQVQGWQQQLNIAQTFRKFLLKIDGFWLNSRQDSLRSIWQRLSTDLSYQSKLVTLGYRLNIDKNRIFNPETDSTLLTQMNFEEQIIYLQNPDTAKVRYKIEYSYRQDYTPIGGKLRQNLRAQTLNFSMNTTLRKTQQISLLATYRAVFNTIIESAEEDNLMGRLDWSGTFWKNLVRSDLTFASTTGRELRREYVFLQVQTGQGTHTWRDENTDSVQDLNEFYLAINPDERQFVKIFLPTTDYIKAFTNNFSYRLNWQLPQKKHKNLVSDDTNKRENGFFSKFSGLLAWTINRRFTADDLEARLIPFAEIADNQLLATQESFRNTLFFNRTELRYGGEFTYLNTVQKQLLSNGFEARNKEEYRLILRRNRKKYWTTQLLLSQSSQTIRSDFLSTRNYAIRTYQISPEVALQPNTEFRVSATYNYSFKENTTPIEMPEQARIHQINVELRWNKLSKRNILTNLRWLNIGYRGEQNTPISYDMLEALQPGVNWTWSINWQERLLNGLQLTLNYEGRKSGTRPLVNIGRAQVTVLF
jgi:hypothetical protein